MRGRRGDLSGRTRWSRAFRGHGRRGGRGCATASAATRKRATGWPRPWEAGGGGGARPDAATRVPRPARAVVRTALAPRLGRHPDHRPRRWIRGPRPPTNLPQRARGIRASCSSRSSLQSRPERADVGRSGSTRDSATIAASPEFSLGMASPTSSRRNGGRGRLRRSGRRNREGRRRAAEAARVEFSAGSTDCREVDQHRAVRRHEHVDVGEVAWTRRTRACARPRRHQRFVDRRRSRSPMSQIAESRRRMPVGSVIRSMTARRRYRCGDRDEHAGELHRRYDGDLGRGERAHPGRTCRPSVDAGARVRVLRVFSPSVLTRRGA